MRLQARDASRAWPLEAAERAVPGGQHGDGLQGHWTRAPTSAAARPPDRPAAESTPSNPESMSWRHGKAPAKPGEPAARARNSAPSREPAPRRDSSWSSAHEWWRWGESNPRPTVVQQDFSGCSSPMIFSAPASHANKDADGLSHLDVPGPPMTRDLSSGSLDDARNRGGSSPRADGLRSSLRRRGRSRCECYRHLLVRAGR